MEHPVVPAGHVVYAVGDIHGRADLLALLLDQIKADAAASVGAKKKTLVFVGDYIDRGPESRRVVDLLLGALPTGFDAHFLKGNHEEMMFEFLEDPSSLRYWLGNGGAATLESYGVDVTGLRRDAAKPEAWRDAFLSALPEQHRRFFESLELTASFGDYLFVHAGIRPGVPLKAQNPQDLIWIRGEFLRLRGGFRQGRGAWTHAEGRARNARQPHRHRHRRILQQQADSASASGRLSPLPEGGRIYADNASRPMQYESLGQARTPCTKMLNGMGPKQITRWS